MDQLLELIMNQWTLLECTDQQKCLHASSLNVSLCLEMPPCIMLLCFQIHLFSFVVVTRYSIFHKDIS